MLAHAFIGVAPLIVAALLMTSRIARNVFAWFILALLLGLFMWPLDAVMKPLLILTLVLAASAAQAQDRTETCTSYQRATGTVVTECRRPDERERHCESTTSYSGTTGRECR